MAVVLVLWAERQRRPSLAIHVEPDEHLHGDRKFLRVLVLNKPIPRIPGLFFHRDPATMCAGHLTFLTEGNHPVFRKGHRMAGRWSRTPEPVSFMISDKSVLKFRDPTRSTPYVDIPPGASEPLDVAMRSRSDEKCFGWHNNFVENPSPQLDDIFDLARGRYHVLVNVRTAGLDFQRVFRVVNDHDWDHFRLEELRMQPKLDTL